MINISYIRLLNAFEAFANAHMQIKRFASDFPEQLPNFATEKEKYPVLFVSPTNSIFDENANKLVVTVYCFDIIEKDRSNINTILSDTNQIINDVYRWFKDGDIEGIDVITDAPLATPINNALLDYAAGWQMTITFDVGTYGICEIPFNDSPVVITEVCDIVYSQYLTCETLGDCETIINIEALLPTQDQKDAMDNANNPDASNPFATIADLSGGGESLEDVLAEGNSTGDFYIDAPDALSHFGILSGGQLDWTSDNSVYAESWIYGDKNAVYVAHNTNWITVNNNEIEGTANSGSFLIDNDQAYIYSTLGGFFSTDGILVGPRFVQISTVDLKIAHDTAITITSGPAGAEYAADYSAGYTNRSLVDKEYVDSLTPPTPTLASVLAAGNTTSGNNIEVSNNDFIIGNGSGPGYITFGSNGGNISIVTQTNSISKGAIAITAAKSLTLTGTTAYVNGLTIGKGTANVATNTAYGIDALLSITTGSSNTAIGYETLVSNQATVGNVAIGRGALKMHNQFDGNTAIGYNALTAQTSGQFNVAIGYNCMPSNLTGNGNLAIGTNALASSTNGSDNTAIGYSALISMTSGTDNVAIGKFAMVNATAGPAQNTVIGDSAGGGITSGANTTIIGYNAGSTNVGSDSTIIGRGMNQASAGDGQLVIGANGIRMIEGASTGAITIGQLAGTGTRIIGATSTGLLTDSVSTTNLAEGSNLYFTNARAIAATLTGFTSGAGTITSSDSVLSAIQKLDGNVKGIVEWYDVVLDGQGGVVANNSKATMRVPFTGTIIGWTLLETSDTPITSSVTLDAWKNTYTNYPPVVGNSIFGTKPALSSAIKNQATGLSIAVTAGDILIINVDSNSLGNKYRFGFDIRRS